MPDIRKRRPECNTIKDVVLANLGVSENDFFDNDKEYFIDGILDAATIIKDTIDNKIPITIIGDYDTDGICASAIMKLTLSSLGATVKVRLPRRFSEGYGLSEKIVDEISDGLIITVDNGITAYRAIEKAKEKGLKVIVTDHHLAPENGILPNADILIDPNAIPNSATFNGYCGAGLAYKLALALIGNDFNIIPKIKSLAAIATVADVMELVEDNRNIVIAGLKTMVTSIGCTSGLKALLQKCECDHYVTPTHIGFKIAPMINAPGRLMDDGAMISYDTISFNGNSAIAEQKAQTLFNYNEQRKSMKEAGLKIVIQNINNNHMNKDSILIIYEPNLSEGLLGIFAGQIAEEYKVPCFVLSDTNDKNILKGSGRTYGDINIKKILDENSSFLLKYGGHSAAAGISLERKNLNDFREAMIFSTPSIVYDDIVYYDLDITPDQIENNLAELETFAPFGQGNPDVVFRIKEFILSPSQDGKCYKLMGNDSQHIKFFGKNVTAIGFDMADKYFNMSEPTTLELIGKISQNYFKGNFSTQVELTEILDNTKIISKTDMAAFLSKMAKERYSK